MASIRYPRRANTRLTTNFKQDEFDCRGGKCCSCGCRETLIDSKLLRKLQVLRNRVGRGVSVNSGYRCPRHNKCQGGTPNSYHTKGKAADIRVSDGSLSPSVLALKAQEVGFKGIGVYPGRIHVDVRPSRYYYNKPGKEYIQCGGFGGKKQTCPHRLGESTLKRNSTGDAVKALQWIISWAGYPCKVDGVFGDDTLAALKAFQAGMGLTVDGICGEKTLEALREVID